nr:rna-binding kh domain-containing protein rcf3 [Quercus suber]
MPHINSTAHRASDDAKFGPRLSANNIRSNNYASHSSSFIESGVAHMVDHVQPYYGEDIMFRILCPIDKVDSVVGEANGILELLRNEIGVDVKVIDLVVGLDEQIIIISSEEGPNDEMFPAQEALLHIQTCIVDLVLEKDNIITTRLLVPSSDIGCLEGRDGSLLEMKSTAHRASDDAKFGPRLSANNIRSNNYASHSSSFIESGVAHMVDHVQPYYGEDIMFRILCPIDKVDSVVGEANGILELLRNEIGVDVKVIDLVVGLDEQIIIISSEEGPNDEMFPAQEALLHIQTCIVDLVLEKDNIITTRLLVPSSDIGCLEGRDGSLLEMKSMAAVPAQIRDEFGLGPIEDSVLRFLKEHRLCVVWEGKVMAYCISSPWSYHVQDPRALTCRGRNDEFR